MLDSVKPLHIDVWIHAVSLGEVIAITPLVEDLLLNNKKILITTMTPTGAARVQQYFGEQVTHRYVPYDISIVVKQFFKKIKPKVAVMVETELWPNLIYFAKKAGIPLLLVNARLSQKSFKGYQKIRFLITPILRQFKLILVQTAADEARFKALGADSKQLKIVGNIKFDLKTKHINNDIFLTLKGHWGNARTVLIAASTHENEEQQLLLNFKRLQEAIPDIILLIAPRHPERFLEIAVLSNKLSFKTGLRSQIDTLKADSEVVIIDSLGELLGFYQISDYAFVGGSLVPVGGHNVLEPIAMKIPVFTGPHVHNFKAICRDLLEAKAILFVKDANELVDKIILLNQDHIKRMELIHNANEVLQKNKGALGQYLKVIETYL